MAFGIIDSPTLHLKVPEHSITWPTDRHFGIPNFFLHPSSTMSSQS